MKQHVGERQESKVEAPHLHSWPLPHPLLFHSTAQPVFWSNLLPLANPASESTHSLYSSGIFHHVNSQP